MISLPHLGALYLISLIAVHGVPNTSSKERSANSIQASWLNLSPWELNVVNDLMVEISLLKCTHMDKPAGRSMKKYISDTFQIAPLHSKMTPSFFTTYNNLAQCLRQVDEATRNHGKSLLSAASALGEQHSSLEKSEDTKGWIKNVTPTEKESDNDGRNNDFMKETEVVQQVQVSSEEKTIESTTTLLPLDSSQIGYWKLIALKLGHWFSDTVRFKREVTPEFQPNDTLASINVAKELKSTEESTTEAMQNFENMMKTMNRIIMRTCPVELRPSFRFSQQAMREIVKWIGTSEDSFSINQASKKYFENANLLKQAQKCLPLLSKGFA